MKNITTNPLLIAILSISYLLFGLHYFNTSKSEVEIRGAYNELVKIADELSESDEPGKIKQVISAFSGDIVAGFKEGFGSNGKDDLSDFLSVRDKITISSISKGKSSWKSKEKIIGKIKNNSTRYISTIKLNLTSYSEDNKMIDSSTSWFSDIKVLAPNEEVSFSINRDLGSHSDSEDVLAQNASHHFTVTVMSFDIKEIASESD